LGQWGERGILQEVGGARGVGGFLHEVTASPPPKYPPVSPRKCVVGWGGRARFEGDDQEELGEELARVEAARHKSKAYVRSQMQFLMVLASTDTNPSAPDHLGRATDGEGQSTTQTSTTLTMHDSPSAGEEGGPGMQGSVQGETFGSRSLGMPTISMLKSDASESLSGSGCSGMLVGGDSRDADSRVGVGDLSKLSHSNAHEKTTKSQSQIVSMLQSTMASEGTP
jgi:hypothetical protein